MQTRLKRAELDELAKQYSLGPDGVDALLDLAGARPGHKESLTFLARCFRYAAVLSLAASVVFFVAANWSRIPVFGRFALIEALLVAFTVAALVRPPPAFTGRAALLLAFVGTGALLALFGQTYQTGADVYELFLTWSLLGLPFVVAAQWSVTSAAWLCVLDLALCLFCGWNPRGGFLWIAFGDDRFSASHALLSAAALNLVGWFVAGKLDWPAVPDWVRRLTLFFGVGFVTWLGFIGVFTGDAWNAEGEDWIAIWTSLFLLALVATVAMRQRRDIFPLAAVAGSFVFLVTCWIARWMDDSHEGVFFMMALWLIAASTLGSRGLMRIAREWREVPT
ncbi:MAG TPA: DUF2157 domain-containing protein [Steroidobacteraceae bacterium]|nr:DUF2157 domain-containing protein [Steroidobacteraceae bacterium]